jgi:predicted Zn-dependent protease
MPFARLACLSLALAGCAAQEARYATLESCTTESCARLERAAAKMQAAADYKLERILLATDDGLNAFAARDKNDRPLVVVTVGMLNAVGTDEDAWAGLFGHEIAHHVKRHREAREGASAKAYGTGQVVANVISAIIPGVGGLVGATVGGNLAQSAVYGSYTRPQEAEADEAGLRWMLAAGYDPNGVLRLFEILGKRAASSSRPAFLSTHPATEERANAVKEFIAHNRKPGDP